MKLWTVTSACAAFALAASATASAAADLGAITGEKPWAVDPAVGVWVPTVTQVDCASGQPLAIFEGMSVLHHGGTLSETNSSPPTTRGAGWGTWEHIGGRQYRSQWRFLRYAADGSFSGVTVVRRQFNLSANGEEASGESHFDIVAPNGVVVFSGCATDVTTRFR